MKKIIVLLMSAAFLPYITRAMHQDLSGIKDDIRKSGAASVQKLIDNKIIDLFLAPCDSCNETEHKNGVALDLSGLGLTSLEGIEKIKDGRPIVYISLKDNNLEQISAQAFASFPQVEIIDLSNNRLSSLPEGLFSTNKVLKAVSFESNNLKALPQDITRVKFVVLELYDNPLSFEERARILEQLPTLRTGLKPHGVKDPRDVGQKYRDVAVLKPCCVFLKRVIL